MLVRRPLEFSEWRLTQGSFRARLVILYRPPYSAKHPATLRMFFDDFTVFLESIILSPEPLIITGDFNIHVNQTDVDSEAMEFLDILESMGLKQHVIMATHENGHTLHLLITRQYENVISGIPGIGRFISHHATVVCSRSIL